MTSPYYASECYRNFGVFTYAGMQFGPWWPTLALAQQAADLLNKAAEHERNAA